jgi:hypothetical protein
MPISPEISLDPVPLCLMAVEAFFSASVAHNNHKNGVIP